MLAYLWDGSAPTIVRAATQRYKLEIKLAFSPIYRILIPGQVVQALILRWQAPGRVATGVPLDSIRKKIPVEKAEMEPRSTALEVDTLTARPTRRSPSSRPVWTSAAVLGVCAWCVGSLVV